MRFYHIASRRSIYVQRSYTPIARKGDREVILEPLAFNRNYSGLFSKQSSDTENANPFSGTIESRLIFVNYHVCMEKFFRTACPRFPVLFIASRYESLIA